MLPGLRQQQTRQGNAGAHAGKVHTHARFVTRRLQGLRHQCAGDDEHAGAGNAAGKAQREPRHAGVAPGDGAGADHAGHQADAQQAAPVHVRRDDGGGDCADEITEVIGRRDESGHLIAKADGALHRRQQRCVGEAPYAHGDDEAADAGEQGSILCLLLGATVHAVFHAIPEQVLPIKGQPAGGRCGPGLSCLSRLTCSACSIRLTPQQARCPDTLRRFAAGLRRAAPRRQSRRRRQGV